MGTNISIDCIGSDKLFLDRLPVATRRAFLLCAKLQFLKGSRWYLAGGTALALQVGHRQSVDLDFFTPQASIRDVALERMLLSTKHWKTTFREKGTIFGLLQEAKVSFITYPFFNPSSQSLRCGTVKILVPDDIAAMKIIAISQRGRKRDFIDLYWYCNNRSSLAEVIRCAINQYPGQEQNVNHVLKSLTYFTDAENDPMPKLFFKATWKDVKKFFKREVVKVTKEILELK